MAHHRQVMHINIFPISTSTLFFGGVTSKVTSRGWWMLKSYQTRPLSRPSDIRAGYRTSLPRISRSPIFSSHGWATTRFLAPFIVTIWTGHLDFLGRSLYISERDFFPPVHFASIIIIIINLFNYFDKSHSTSKFPNNISVNCITTIYPQ